MIPAYRLLRTRRKTIALIIETDGALTVRAPLRVNRFQIEDLIRQKASWIQKHQERLQQNPPSIKRSYLPGEHFYYLGQTYPLEIVERAKPPLSLENGRFKLSSFQQNQAAGHFINWYRRQARIDIPPQVKLLASQYGDHFKSIRITSAKTRWGSCGSRGTLNFSWRLVMAPPEVIEYVIIHELVHLEVKNHSKSFWQKVAERMPDYPPRRTWLKTNARNLLLSLLVLAIFLLPACSPAAGPTPALPKATTILPASSLEPVSTAHVSTEIALPTQAATEPPQPTSTGDPEAQSSPNPVVVSTASETVGPMLAFLKDGDIWLLDNPESEPYQLTLAEDILNFAWSPDGERLAAYNGRSLCFFQRDGSVRTACLELGLNDEQAQMERKIVWSPDQRWVILWNPTNPQDEDAIGWLVLALDNTNAMWRIHDPVDWGAALAPDNAPGGFTGEPVFLLDGRLLGTLSHRYLCGSGGCRYQLYEFDLAGLTPTFTPYPNQPEAGWSEGRGLLLSPDGDILTNYGPVVFNCDSYHTFVDRFNLTSGERQAYDLENQAVDGMVFAPDNSRAILALTSGCSDPQSETWSQACGLTQGIVVRPMQRWNPGSSPDQELVPGLSPVWSPDGEWIAFRSCLNETQPEEWRPDADTPASVYLLDTSGAIVFVSEGSQPEWRP